MTLLEAWAAWYRGKPKPKEGRPGECPKALVDVLMGIHRSYHDVEGRKIDREYVGGQVYKAIHDWKTPAGQRCISQMALAHLMGSGKLSDLKNEHDPPVAFYRDQILNNKDLTTSLMLDFVLGMKVTKVHAEEDSVLTGSAKKHEFCDKRGSWKSIRPPGAYALCKPKIVPVRYPDGDGCEESLRSKLYKKRKKHNVWVLKK